MFPGPYRVPRFRSHPRTVYTNTCGRGAYRGPWLYGDVVRECLLDVVAVRMAIDPAELRRRNLIAPDELPYTTPSGATYENVSIQETFDLALEMAGYEGFRARQAAARAEGRYLGIGISAYVEPCARGGGRGSLEVATIRVEPTGKVHVIMGTGSHGHSLETTMAQVVADHLGVDIDDITFLQGDTATAPHGGGTAGSRSAVVAGNAARRSAELLREKLLRIAAHMLEAAPEDLEAARGRIAVVGSPDASVSVAEVARTAYVNTLALPEDEEPGLDVTTRYTAPPVTWSNATHVCMVEVDPGTGLVRVEDFVVAEDCGIMINPMVVDGQIAGGVAQGIGGVLLEHLPYDAAGNPLAITLKDYLMPTADTMPDYRIGHIETPSATPGGHKGTGEGGTIGAPAAVMNAVLDALRPFGVEKITTQPLDPTRIMELVGAGPHAAAGAGGPASAPSRAHASG
jgi:carbon-monoxide dehydrogenase large subunit